MTGGAKRPPSGRGAEPAGGRDKPPGPRSRGASRPAGAPAKLTPPRGLLAWRLATEEDVAILEWPTSAPTTPEGLTSAEREVLALVRGGLSNAEIARRRGRSVRTVANQIASIFAKCGVRSRAELFALAAARDGE